MNAPVKSLQCRLLFAGSRMNEPFLQQQRPRLCQHAITLCLRQHRWHSSSDKKIATPEEAGRKAAELSASSVANDSHGSQRRLHPSTVMAHAGIQHGVPNSPMAPPLQFASTYTRPADGIYRPLDATYSRADNPTRLLLERTIFELECASSRQQHQPTTCAFASGMMAATAIFLAHKSPMTVLLPEDVYHGVPTVLADVFASRHSANVKRVDMTSIDDIRQAIESVSSDDDVIVWMETPSNPKCQIIDIKAVCNGVKDYPNVTTVVDGTMTSPVITRPLELGADISLHSATKYLGGHSDALLGVATASPYTKRGQELAPVLKTTQIVTGGVASVMDSWLVLRGIRTLQLRVQQQSQSALAIAKHLLSLLEKHGGAELITAVHYPGLFTHPQHDIAKRQMKLVHSTNNEDGDLSPSFGGVLSVEFKDEIAATAFAGALQTIQRATSLGGTETLIEHRASIEPPGRVTSPPGLLRISVGLEHVEDLVRDIDCAMDIVSEIL